MAGLGLVAHATRRIAITQRTTPATETAPERDMLEATWSAWFEGELRGAPFVAVPNFREPARAVQFVIDCTAGALLLSGGEDIGTNLARDAVEAALLQHALESGWPVIGVCRGMQFLQHATGGDLTELAGHVGEAHAVRTERGSARVNSWHRWGVRQPGAEWRTLATASDGSIEAMRHRVHPWLGIMWHPERSNGGSEVTREWIDEVLATMSPAVRA